LPDEASSLHPKINFLSDRRRGASYGHHWNNPDPPMGMINGQWAGQNSC